jgi:hypothetical protein
VSTFRRFRVEGRVHALPLPDALGRRDVRWLSGVFGLALALRLVPYVCARPDGPVTYYSATGMPLGASSPTMFSTTAKPGALVDTKASETGTIEVIAVGGPLFVANIYSAGHELLYSLGFSYPAIPPLYL